MGGREVKGGRREVGGGLVGLVGWCPGTVGDGGVRLASSNVAEGLGGGC